MLLFDDVAGAKLAEGTLDEEVADEMMASVDIVVLLSSSIPLPFFGWCGVVVAVACVDILLLQVNNDVGAKWSGTEDAVTSVPTRRRQMRWKCDVLILLSVLNELLVLQLCTLRKQNKFEPPFQDIFRREEKKKKTKELCVDCTF